MQVLTSSVRPAENSANSGGMLTRCGESHYPLPFRCCSYPSPRCHSRRPARRQPHSAFQFQSVRSPKHFSPGELSLQMENPPQKILKNSRKCSRITVRTKFTHELPPLRNTVSEMA